MPGLLEILEQLARLRQAPLEGGVHGLGGGHAGDPLVVPVLIEEGTAVVDPVIVSTAKELDRELPVLMLHLNTHECKSGK